MAHNKLNPIAKKYGHHVHKKTADTESKSSLKKRLRDTQRILKRDLPATKRQELERRLEALTAQVGSMDQNSKENELQEKYKYVRFVGKQL